ncbi:gfo/Idh/MocA family oxidoreductase [Gordonia sp. HNM0687]|uniref:Gfo/Idh/MocA family oxidoreductase n=1 Tax=Gordonia mangrovi TaxID=2665643 RepID=A0A6L7GUJ3_9ACTN|nr:Gfo/Idh/MocA family oxidoreductase [Gordonia mangrovi]MXP23560.1 gfo/Idh/MocA family oxidoreductase [Gordonia mangrovi]UVF79628.1 Gfo/Idh/MocA family oxidoreductase [Gordonia mangrovi]
MIRMATIGTSTITGRFIAAAAEVPAVRVATAYSRDADRAARFAAEMGLTGSASDLDQLLSDPAIDAVYIGSPNGIHADQAHAAIAAGKHVLVEKPAVPTEAEFGGLIAAASDVGVTLLEAMRNCYDPGMQAVAALLPELGVLRRASLAYCQRSARYDKVLAGERVNIFDPALAGGALYDLGVYPVAAMVQLFGEPQQIHAAAVPIAGGADGAGAVLAGYDGFVVDLSYSKITASDRANEIQGESGTLTFEHVAEPRSATLTLLDGTVTEYTFDGPANNMVHEVRRFAELVAGADDPTPDHARTLATLRIVERIRAAM